MTPSSVLRPRRSPKALPKARLAPNKGPGHCLVVCCPSDPLQLSQSWWNCSEKYAQQIDEMHSKLPRLQLILVNRMGPVLLCDNARPHVAQLRLQKLNKFSYKVLPHLPYSPDLLPTNYHIKHLNNFLQGKCFHNQQEAENAFQEFVEFQSMDFYATGINRLNSCWQKCVDGNGSYFD